MDKTTIKNWHYVNGTHMQITVAEVLKILGFDVVSSVKCWQSWSSNKIKSILFVGSAVRTTKHVETGWHMSLNFYVRSYVQGERVVRAGGLYRYFWEQGQPHCVYRWLEWNVFLGQENRTWVSPILKTSDCAFTSNPDNSRARSASSVTENTNFVVVTPFITQLCFRSWYVNLGNYVQLVMNSNTHDYKTRHQ